jgi:hypothetical protein
MIVRNEILANENFQTTCNQYPKSTREGSNVLLSQTTRTLYLLFLQHILQLNFQCPRADVDFI